MNFMLPLFVHELVHAVVCLVLALAFRRKLGLIRSLIISFAFGFFADLDHLFDYTFYLINFNRQPSLSEFLSSSYFEISQKLYVPLHSWEAAAALIAIPWFMNQKKKPKIKRLGNISTLRAACILSGMALVGHLVFDQLVNQVSPFAYFWIYRIATSFNGH